MTQYAAQHDGDGKPYYSYEQARAIFTAFKRDRRFPKHFTRAGCSIRCDLMIPDMIHRMGIKSSAIGRALVHCGQMNPIPYSDKLHSDPITSADKRDEYSATYSPSGPRANEIHYKNIAIKEYVNSCLINDGTEAGNPSLSEVDWDFHIAPTLRVGSKNTGIREMVIDPTIARMPVAIDQWYYMVNKSENRLHVFKGELGKPMTLCKEFLDVDTSLSIRRWPPEKLESWIQNILGVRKEVRQHIGHSALKIEELKGTPDWDQLQPSDSLYQRRRTAALETLEEFKTYEKLRRFQKSVRSVLSPSKEC